MSTIYYNPTYLAVKALLDVLFPNTGWQLNLLGSGQTSVAWQAKAYQYSLIVRANVPDIKQSQYAQEFAILELLYARGCPVPEPIATSIHERSRINEFRFNWIITREVEGEPILNKSLSSQNAYKIGELLAHMHNISVQGYGDPHITNLGFRADSHKPIDGVREHWKDYQLWGVHDAVTLESTIIGSKFPKYVPQLNAYKSEIHSALNYGHPAICHADLHTENVLLDRQSTLSAVIDFGDACLLPPAWDFAISARYFGWRAIEDMLIGYTPDESERTEILEQAYLLGLVFGVFKLQRQFVRDAHVVVRARTLQFISHTLNRLKQR